MALIENNWTDAVDLYNTKSVGLTLTRKSQAYREYPTCVYFIQRIDYIFRMFKMNKRSYTIHYIRASKHD